MQQEFTSIPNHIGWRVPNSIFILLSWLVVGLTWTLLIYIYPSLPVVMPTHFAFSGAADASAAKTLWNVFLPAVFQLILVGLTWWLSYHPQYSNLPTGVTITMLPEPTQGFVKHLLSHMLVMTGLVASLIMAYVSLGMVRVGLGLTDRINAWAILGLVGFLLCIIGWYTYWLVKLTRRFSKSQTSTSVS